MKLNILNYISKDKVSFSEIIRQNLLNTSGKSEKTQGQSWGTRTKPTHSLERAVSLATSVWRTWLTWLKHKLNASGRAGEFKGDLILTNIIQNV